jgi:hypothetical protein
MLLAGPELPKAEALVPIGFVSGATPKAGAVVTIPQVADARSSSEVMEVRGRRRAKDDIADGFDDLTAPDDHGTEEES